jgi:hypothetical protein
MNIGLYRIELTGLAGLSRLGGSFFDREAAARYLKRGVVLLPTVLIAAVGAWLMLTGDAGNGAVGEPVTEPVQLATAAVNESLQSASGEEESLTPAPMAAQGVAPAQMTPIDGLKIASQSWRRGGLGSKALVTFTVRNANDFAVRDIEILCSFARRDGSHLTDRRRTIPDVVDMKSRKTFAHVHVGFVNVNADRAKCSLVTASRI